MLQTMPFPIGRLIAAYGRGDQQVRQGEFPVTLPEFARMGDTSNGAIRRFQAERGGASQESPPMGNMMEKRTMMKPTLRTTPMPRDATAIPSSAPPQPPMRRSMQRYSARDPVPEGPMRPSSVLHTERTGGAMIPDLPDRGSVGRRPGPRPMQDIDDYLNILRRIGR